MTRAPLPCGWTPDPATTALHRMADAGNAYATAVQAANGDPDLTAAAYRELETALDVIEADIGRATAEAHTETRSTR